MDTNFWMGQLFTLAMIACALGFDAFSLGIGIGLKGIRLLDVLKLSIIIGVFHVLMPIGGMLTGQLVSQYLGTVAVTAAGILLIFLGTHMIYSSFRGDEVQSFNYRTLWGIILLAFSVSVDAFSVGITLGMFATDFWLTILLFGMFGAGMSMLGLLLGRKVSQNLGEYGEALGGVILIVFGVYFIL